METSAILPTRVESPRLVCTSSRRTLALQSQSTVYGERLGIYLAGTFEGLRVTDSGKQESSVHIEMFRSAPMMRSVLQRGLRVGVRGVYVLRNRRFMFVASIATSYSARWVYDGLVAVRLLTRS